jgi:hypothetical protein
VSAPEGDAPRPGAPDRPARRLGAFGLLLVAVLGAGLGVGALVGPVTPPGAPAAPAAHDGDHPAPDHG